MLRLIPDMIPCGIAVLDERGCCVYTNNVLAMVLDRRIYTGQRMEDYLALACKDERHRRQVNTAWREAVWAKQSTACFSLAAADGRSRRIEVRPVVLPGGLLMVSFRDITSEGGNDSLPDNSERVLRRTLLQSPTPVIVSDLVGETREVNDALVDLLGFGREEWQSLLPQRWLSIDSQLARDAALDRVLQEQDRKEILEVDLRHRNGHRIPAKLHLVIVPNAQGEPLLTVSYLEPLHPGRASFGVLEDSSSPDLKRSLRSESVLLLRTDLEGRIIEWTEGAVKCFGYQSGTAIHRSLEEIFRPTDYGAFGAQVETAVATPLGALYEWPYHHVTEGCQTGRFHVEAAGRGGHSCTVRKLP